MTPQLMFRETLIEMPLADKLADEIYCCPICGYIGTLDTYDCLGADEDCVFCNGCNNELRLPQ